MSSPSLKLALVTRRYPPMIGGAEKVLSYLAGALAQEGARVTVVTSRDPAGPRAVEHGDAGAVSPKDPAVVRLATAQTRFVGTWIYMRNLERWFRSHPVDLAYVSMLKHDAYVAIGAGERLGFPVVVRPEGAGLTGDLAWQSWGRFGRAIGLRCRLASAFVAISPRIQDEIEQSWQTGTLRPSLFRERLHPTTGRPRIESLPNGVPIPETPWRPRPGWRTAPRAVFVGRLAVEKSLDLLIHAWPLVRAQHPAALLVLIGEGPMRGSLEALAGELGLSLGFGQAIAMPGAIQDVEEMLRGADLFVLPSAEEGMSIALLEAMALGIPVVASSIPGNRALVSDGRHGRLAESNPAEFAQAILDQWRDFDRAIAMGQAARRRVADEFSIRAVARRHLALFEELIAAHRQKPT